MSDKFRILPAVNLTHAARACPLLESEAEEWVECCTRRFYPLAKRIAGDDDLAMDVLQESWSKIMQAVHAYRGDPPACAWVAAIVANTAKAVARERSRDRTSFLTDQTLQLADPGKTPEELARDKQLLQLLGEMIALLPEMYREVLELRYGRGVSTATAAELLHISQSAVATRLNRAVSMLRRQIEARLQGVR